VKKAIALLLVAAFAAFAWLLLPSPGSAPVTASGSGLLQQVDREAGVVTISHGALPALNMVPMTMTYSVKDRTQLASLKPMQQVEFKLAYDGNDYVILEIR
jgi:Cu/Ag efflux protein CusF